ncbi:hypothetical protein D3C73_1506740 [compost metagenome]
MSGRASGRATSDDPDGFDSPTRFVAVTWNVYSTLFVRPSSVHVVDWQSLVYGLPWTDRTVYFVISAPLFAGAP